MNTAMVAESFLRHAPADGSAPHLVSIQRDPERAAALEGTIGSIQLRYHSLQLVPVDLLDDLPGTWHALLDTVEGFLADGLAEARYPSIDAGFRLDASGGVAKFTAGKVRHIVDAGELIDCILGGAAEYFRFAPGTQDAAIARIGRLRTRAAAAGLSA
ncbi:hypothetical protein KRR55_03710 [Paeniglutamicibacter sp. ABSL32-1]|uniref:hypothetical protein n=1 Tax=Paeniglutamicibacter quisquiliarum TaxID=2849498 RepID=UPI001C2D9842|nr:hypothetical protein [Paeniglutamicibacter quisquiliarum]MBV1778221.1 hypothetical protein [Paeniglutamicibacter quisquiliarum]